jgi:5-(carboxyamino)imidazole ribonucleotide synthase
MTIGILGGGQLGRMLATAAAEMGISTHIYSPDPDSPAFAAAAARTVAAYEDEAALADFARSVAAVTYEFENVPAQTAEFLARQVPVHPNPRALEIAQDRFAEKSLMTRLGIAIPPFALVESLSDIYSALAKAGRPAILKTRRFGYDGKGQALIRTGDDPVGAWRAIGEVPAIMEAFVPLEREISVIIARGHDGTMRAYDIGENRHEAGILAVTTVPTSLPAAVQDDAIATAEMIAEALDYVGILAVEMFVIANSSGHRLLVNEIAPRVHNSGHWTQDGCIISQFEQHIRAIAGWPLGKPVRHGPVTMTNLIGDEVKLYEQWLTVPGASVHLYGKAHARPGRKMGHVTQVFDD